MGQFGLRRLPQWAVAAAAAAIHLSMAAGETFGLLEGALLLVGLCTAWRIGHELRDGPRALLTRYPPLRRASTLALLVACYAAQEVLSAAWSGQWGHLFDKYKVVVPMVVFALAIVLFCDGEAWCGAIRRLSAGCALFIAAFTLVNNIFLRILPVYYSMRSTLRVDYNMYARSLLVGLVCMACEGMLHPPTGKRRVGLLMAGAFVAAVLWTSASRRVFILACVLGIVWAWMIGSRYAEADAPERRRARWARFAVWALIGALLVAVLSAAIGASLQAASRARPLVGSDGRPSAEQSAAERYETVFEGSALTKRLMIWRIAWQAYQQLDLPQKLVGAGAFADIPLYDETDDPQMDALYDRQKVQGLMSAHCFLLADLYDGGLLRVALAVTIMVLLAKRATALYQVDRTLGSFYLCVFAVILVDALISNRYGVLYDKYLWLFLALFFCDETRCAHHSRPA